VKNIKILLINRIKLVPRHLWILLIIICVGAFLRTYNLHEWLEFRTDQVRDSYLVEKVISNESSWPLLGPYMYSSGSSKELFYHLGPIYYYFQIISGKLFGSFPDKFAYPDVFFSILSIPLFFLFLRLYFNKNLSLSLAALYSVSAYFVHYSRFAWNSNLIPFFVLLFLFSVYKILNDDRKNCWLWAVFLGFSWGVGFQLHAILMILFSVIVLCTFFMSIRINASVWKKWIMVVVIFVVLNGGQIINEINTNFSNTKRLFNFSSQSERQFENEQEKKEIIGYAGLLKNDISCSIEANYFFLSSYGNSDCSYGILNFFSLIKKDGFAKIFENICYWLALLLGVIFSIIGYFLLIFHTIKEKMDERKLFLRLILFYAVVFFLIMIPLSIERFSDLRYFMPVFFVPFVLLGLIVDIILKKYPKVAFSLIITIFFTLLLSNVSDFKSDIKALIRKDKICSSRVATLGEIESVAEYIMSNLKGQKNLYISGNHETLVAVDPLAYLLKKNNFNPVVVKDENSVILQNSDKPAFLISCRSKKTNTYNYFKVDNMYVYDMNSRK